MSFKCLSIGTLERDSGIARDTLCISECRFRFPELLRNYKGQRIYSKDQLSRPQYIRRLLNQGFRPGKVLALNDSDLEFLEASLYPNSSISGAYQYKNIHSHLVELRESIPKNVDLWSGGEGIKRMRNLPSGVKKITSFDQVPL